MSNYRILHGGVGRFVQHDVISEAQAGSQIDRLVRLGAIAPTDAELTVVDDNAPLVRAADLPDTASDERDEARRQGTLIDGDTQPAKGKGK